MCKSIPTYYNDIYTDIFNIIIMNVFEIYTQDFILITFTLVVPVAHYRFSTT